MQRSDADFSQKTSLHRYVPTSLCGLPLSCAGGGIPVTLMGSGLLPSSLFFCCRLSLIHSSTSKTTAMSYLSLFPCFFCHESESVGGSHSVNLLNHPPNIVAQRHPQQGSWMDGKQATSYGEVVEQVRRLCATSRRRRSGLPPPVSSTNLQDWMSWVVLVISDVERSRIDWTLTLAYWKPEVQQSTQTDDWLHRWILNIQRRRDSTAHRFHQAVRWTVLLAYWIERRVLHMAATLREDALPSHSDRVSLVEEVHLYTNLFLPRARQILATKQGSRIAMLLGRISQLHFCGSPMRCPSSVYRPRRCVLDLYAAVARAVQSAGRDTLQITWDYLRCSTSETTAHLQHMWVHKSAPKPLPSSSDVQQQHKVREVLHTATLGPFIQAMEVNLPRIFSHLTPVDHHVITACSAALQFVGNSYDVKMAAMAQQPTFRLYYVFPLLCDFDTCLTLLCENATAEQRHNLVELWKLEEVRDSLRSSALDVITDAVKSALSAEAYRRAGKGKHSDCRISDSLTISPGVFHLIDSILAPSINVLSRSMQNNPAEKQSFAAYRESARSFYRFLLDTVKWATDTTGVDPLQNASAQQQRCTDGCVLRLYIQCFTLKFECMTDST